MKRIFILACILLLISCILYSSVVRAAVVEAVEMCITSIVPSIFVFTALSSVITDYGMPTVLTKSLGFIFNKLLGISSHSVTAVLLGWTAGFPVGAICVRKLYDSGCISKEEAEYLLSFCSVSSISFVFGVIGGTVYGNTKIAAALYAVQIFSSIAVAILMKGTYDTPQTKAFETKRDFNISDSLVTSVRNAVKSTAYICGYVIFFSVLCDIILLLFPIIPEFPLIGVLELTSSVFMLKEFPIEISIVLASALLSWSGMCIHFQMKSCVGDISLKKYYLGKLLHVGISSLITLLLYSAHNVSVYRECISINYRNDSPDLFFLIIFFVVMGCFFLKNDVK